MAEFIMKNMIRKAGLEDGFLVESAAVSAEETGNTVYPDAKRALRNHGIPFHDRKARKIREDDIRFDHIYVMDTSNLQRAKRLLPLAASKIERLLPDQDISDPWYSGKFEQSYQEIERGCRLRLEEILDQKKKGA